MLELDFAKQVIQFERLNICSALFLTICLMAFVMISIFLQLTKTEMAMNPNLFRKFSVELHMTTN